MVNSERVKGVLRCANPLNKREIHRLRNFFETTHFCHAYYELYPVNKRLRSLERIQFISKSSSIYTKSV